MKYTSRPNRRSHLERRKPQSKYAFSFNYSADKTEMLESVADFFGYPSRGEMLIDICDVLLEIFIQNHMEGYLANKERQMRSLAESGEIGTSNPDIPRRTRMSKLVDSIMAKYKDD